MREFGYFPRMILAICGELEADREQLAAVAAASGADETLEYAPVADSEVWDERFAANLTAAEAFLEGSRPALVLTAGAGSIALATSLAATRGGFRLARLVRSAGAGNREAARDATLADHLAELLICFSEADREGLSADSLRRAAICCETPDQAGAAISALLRAPGPSAPAL